MENNFFKEVASVKMECEKSSGEEIRQTYEHVLKKINAQESRKQPKRKIQFRCRYAVCAAAAAVCIMLPAVYSLRGRIGINIDKAAFIGAGKNTETENAAFAGTGKNAETENAAFAGTGKNAETENAAFGSAGKNAETENAAFGSAGKNTGADNDTFGETGKAAQELESDLLEANDYAMALLRGNNTGHASGRAGGYCPHD